MFKRFLVIILILITSMGVYAAEAASCIVTLNTSNIRYFECGFTAEANPEHPFLKETNGVSTRAIGGIVAADNIDIINHGNLNIYSSTYTIWALKIGYKTVKINLTCNPLLLGNNNSKFIPYNLYIDKISPESVPAENPTVSISNKAKTIEITNRDMDNGFIKFWITKFMMRIPSIPINAEIGEYKGSLKMIIQSN